ncbi:LysR family transcriptional regulator [Pseudohaliea rubra]|uniref:LysR-family transcriptional regulator n=1 Tax=Pseudohaliea rubra DSM 19751 TaxID=1265313 RepID=A0A095X125_9GAMM|nr:LysR family transcriptional regulator [Pseudohaliea rubra]KGE04569.1 LysR-family transcriptional regulator [Pseudohaliea rubra DSM 19751]
MPNGDLDFKVLVVFQTLMETRQVSTAADRLNIGQSNVSRALAKLRQHFEDPLFVRTRRGMEPTPRAVQLAKSVEEMLHIYEKSLTGYGKFDPGTSHRIFHIAGSEVAHVLGLSRITRTLLEQAPSVQLHAVPLGVNALAKHLETDVDLALGPFPKLYAGIHERNLFTEDYSCFVRQGHPDIGDSLTLEQFEQAQHIVVNARRLGHIHEQIQSELLKAIPAHKQRLVTYNFVTAALLAESTDCIVTLPTGTAKWLGRGALRALAPPIDLPTFEVKLYWHERFHHDPAHVWLRGVIHGALTGAELQEGSPRR